MRHDIVVIVILIIAIIIVILFMSPWDFPFKNQTTRVVPKNDFFWGREVVFATWLTRTLLFLEGHPGSLFFREGILRVTLDMVF